MGLQGIVPAGVVTGDNLLKLMQYCKDNKCALPGTNSYIVIFLAPAFDGEGFILSHTKDCSYFYCYIL